MITNCAHCAYWTPHAGNKGMSGHCRFNPPSVVASSTPTAWPETVWPVTEPKDGCGKGSPYLCIEPGCNAPATDDYNERCFECRAKHEDEQESDDYLGDGIFAANH